MDSQGKMADRATLYKLGHKEQTTLVNYDYASRGFTVENLN